MPNCGKSIFQGFVLYTLQFIQWRHMLRGKSREAGQQRRIYVVAQTRGPKGGGGSACAWEKKEDLVDTSPLVVQSVGAGSLPNWKPGRAAVISIRTIMSCMEEWGDGGKEEEEGKIEWELGEVEGK